MKKITIIMVFLPLLTFSQGKFYGGNGSGYASSELVISTLSISEISQEVGIYPNPSASIIQLKVTLRSDSKIIDVNGKTVLSLKPNTTQINISKLAQGTYFLIYKNNVYRFIKK